jgi:hypothetical protein
MILYKVEEVIQAIEVIPEELPSSSESSDSKPAIAQVRITRLLSAEQVLERIMPLQMVSTS